MSGLLSVSTRGLDSFEGLHQAIKGSHVEVTQLGRGKFRGSLSHVGIGDFSLSVGSFSVGVRTQRTPSDDKLVVGMLLNAENRVTHWSFDMRPADVLVIPPNTEHDGTFHGAAAYAAIRLDITEVASLFKGDARLSDPAAWLDKNHYRADPSIGVAATRRLPLIISRLAQQQAALSDTSVDFWKRSIIDAVTGTIMHSLPPDTRGPLPSAMHLVWSVDDYLDAAGLRPVHISEICAQLNVSGGPCIAHSMRFSVWDRSPIFVTSGFVQFIPSLRIATLIRLRLRRSRSSTASSSLGASRIIIIRCSMSTHRKRLAGGGFTFPGGLSRVSLCSTKEHGRTVSVYSARAAKRPSLRPPSAWMRRRP